MLFFQKSNRAALICFSIDSYTALSLAEPPKLQVGYGDFATAASRLPLKLELNSCLCRKPERKKLSLVF